MMLRTAALYNKRSRYKDQIGRGRGLTSISPCKTAANCKINRLIIRFSAGTVCPAFSLPFTLAQLITPNKTYMSKILLTWMCILVCAPKTFSQTYYLLNSSSAEKDINWSDHSLITSNNDWSAIPYIKGFRGDGLTATTDVDPRTVTSDGTTTPSVVYANVTTDPNSNSNDGFAEFESLANPTLAFRASSTASAPFLMFYVNTQNPDAGFFPYIDFTLRDIDGSGNNAIQQVSIQYRVGESGPFTTASESFYTLSPSLDFFSGYNPDVTTGPFQASHRARCEFDFPPACLNQPQVQVRVVITNSSGGNEWVGIDDIVLGGYETIKIRYSKFAAVAQNNSVLLNWTANTESPMERFEVERSDNGARYDKISTVFSKGTGDFDYNYTDASPIKGNAFYRLKLFHADGSFSYTHIVKVNWATRGGSYISSVYPAPATSVVNLQVNSAAVSTAVLQLHSITGAVVKKQNLSLTIGSNDIPVDISSLPAGSYFIRVKVNGTMLTERFIKQ